MSIRTWVTRLAIAAVFVAAAALTVALPASATTHHAPAVTVAAAVSAPLLAAAHGTAKRVAASRAQARRTVPTVTYLVSQREMITTNATNPSNYNIRAWETCRNSSGSVTARKVGGWHQAIGAKSYTGQCATGSHVSAAGFDYNKSNPVRRTCYTAGRATSGYC